MMGENPNYWWSLKGKVPPPTQQGYPTFVSAPPVMVPPPVGPPSSLLNPPYLFGSSLLLPLSNPTNLTEHHHHHDNQDFPLSWSQLLLTGIANEEEQNLNFSSIKLGAGHVVDHEVKNGSFDQQSRQFYYHNKDNHHENDKNNEDNDHDPGRLQDCSSSWSSQLNPIQSVGSSSTTNLSTSTMFDFSSKIDSRNQRTNQYSSQPSSETFTSGTSKRARVQQSSTQPPLKARKEKLSDRISALHQLVSPFGKTDTASVLFEATAHIRFLEAQIEALSSPYMNLSKNVSGSMRHQHSDGKGGMVSRGLCLVPVSCIEDMDTTNMTNNGAEYWTPALGAGF